MQKLIHERASSQTDLANRPRLESALFHYYCVAHRLRSVERSPVTIFQRHWAYCVQGCGPGHEWVAIEPISDVDLLWFGPTFLQTPEPQLAPA